MKMLKDEKKNKRFFGFILIFIAMMLIYSRIELVRLYDAGNYWNRGVSLWDEEQSFSLLNMKDGFRGYVFPLYLGICNKIGGETCYKIVNALLVSLFFTFIFPDLQKSEKGEGWREAITSFLCFLIFSFFFWGLEVYSLSDFMAMLLCGTAVLLENRVRGESRWLYGAGLSVLFGAVVYVVYNVRTIYLFPGIYLVLLFIWHLYRSGKSIVSKMTAVLGALAGGLLGGAPQGYMNYHNLGILSMKVPTSGLMLKQLYWGLQTQRYDTYIGTKQMEQHPMPQTVFTDAVGRALVERTEIIEFSSWSDFFGFIWKHPVEMAGIYVRHLVNMLLPCWPEQYVVDLDNQKLVPALLAYVLFFSFGMVLLNRCMKFTNVWLNYFALLIPVLFILPGAVETRFFAPLYLVATGVLGYHTDWGKLKEYIHVNYAKILVLFVLIGLLLISLWSNMLVSESSYSIFFS